MDTLRHLDTDSKKDIKDELISIIQNKRLTRDFQPIINFSKPEQLCYEALIRPLKDSYFPGP